MENSTANQNNAEEIISQSAEEIKSEAEENTPEIVLIDIEKLHPHEDNPRKDIGDVSELAESIKKHGILQNLTVVPATGYWHGDYIVVIGHRRLEGSKLAGLKKVPCVIREMTPKEQIATMLLENIQRSDLTIYEQAQGMQMMLDLGETVESIAEKTGFSQTTVRRRVRIATLNSDKVKEAQGRQINITEFDKLFEVEDADKRNDLLNEIGTSNFAWSLRRAKENEQQKKSQLEVIKALGGKADEISNNNTKELKWVDSANSAEDIPEFKAGVNYYYSLGYNGYVYIYRDYTEEEKSESNKAEEIKKIEWAKRAERESKFDELFKQAFNMRMDFVRGLNNFKGKEDIIYEMAGKAICRLNTAWREGINEDVFNAVMETSIETPFAFERISQQTDWTMKTLLAMVYSVFEDEDEVCYTYDFEYEQNSELDTLYYYLEKLGYEKSDEEKALLDGTHEMYEHQEENEEENEEENTEC